MAFHKADYSQYQQDEYEKYETWWKGYEELDPDFLRSDVIYHPDGKAFVIRVSDVYEYDHMRQYYEEVEGPLSPQQDILLDDGELAEQKKEIQQTRSRYTDTFTIEEGNDLFAAESRQPRINYLSGTDITVPLGEGILNFCYADFEAAWKRCEVFYTFFSEDRIGDAVRKRKTTLDDVDPESPTEPIHNYAEEQIRLFTRYGDSFTYLSEMFYSSLYTAVFPPLFKRHTNRSIRYYRAYLNRLQKEMRELIGFCFDESLHPEALRMLHPSERYGLWCHIKNLSASSMRQERFTAMSIRMSGSKIPFGMPKGAFLERAQAEVILSEEQKAFAREYGIEDAVLELFYRFPRFVETSYACASVRDMLYLEFTKMLEEDIRFQKCGRCGKYFIRKGNYNGSYCDRVAPEEKRSCQQLAAQEAYQKKLGGNDGNNALNIYQKYYKRYFARVSSGALKKDAFKRWQYEAVGKRSDCIDGKITLEEYIGWLESSMPNRKNKNKGSA